MSIRRGGLILLICLLMLGPARRGWAYPAFAPVYNPGNGHWYQAVPVSGGITWDEARAAAAFLSYAGAAGHLATITSPAENDFIASRVPEAVTGGFWLGAFQPNPYAPPNGGWQWVTGEPFYYTNWNGGEPNDYFGPGSEDALHLWANAGGRWNDLRRWQPLDGFLVEYDVPGLVAAQLTLYPNPVVGGQPAVGQLTLTLPASAGGVVVTLSSSNPAAAVVPATVFIPPGAASATFPITTFPVPAAAVTLISAGCLGGTATAALQVLPGSPPAGNLLINGSFEEPQIPGGAPNFKLTDGSLPGWRIVQGNVDVVQSWQPAPGQGRQSLDLVGDRAGAIEQRVPTEPGRTYRFSGWLAHNPGIPYGRAHVLLDGAFFTQLVHDLPSTDYEMRWVPFSASFRAANSVTTLTLVDVTGLSDLRGLALDGLVLTPVDGPGPRPPLAAPTGLIAQAVSDGQVNLTWTDNSSDETGFALFRRAGGSDWTRIALVQPNVTRFADLDIRPGITYVYRVQAVRDGEASAWSNEAAAVAPSDPPPPSPPTPPPAPLGPPAAPSGLAAQAVSSTRVELSWSDNSNDETAFAVWRKGGGPLTLVTPTPPADGDWVRIAVVTPNTTRYADLDVQPDTTYVYRVRAISHAGASAWSNEAEVQLRPAEAAPRP